MTSLEPMVSGGVGLPGAATSAGLAGSKQHHGAVAGAWGAAAWNHGDGMWGAVTDEARGLVARSNGAGQLAWLGSLPGAMSGWWRSATRWRKAWRKARR